MSKIQNWTLSKVARLQTLRHEDEEGQGLAEYGLILALIAVVCIAALTALGGGVRDKITSVANAL
ncbi:MAG: hypothetical protein AMXMBFR80_20700 [Dehalococcoidia bacterium]|jgi:pilus assembly protein Flp/PilA|nr:Flp family type IVb pilin [Tepidiformaceae bacterium]